MLHHDQRLAGMAGGNDVSESTVCRRRDELIGLLAAQAPRLDRALMKVAKRGGEVVLSDGTLVRTRRRTGRAGRRNYLGERRGHGLHLVALTGESGRLVWISAARPGRTHDNTAARHGHILAHLRAAGLGALADLGFCGLDNEIRGLVIVTGLYSRRTQKLTSAGRSQPGPRRRTRTGRARLRPPRELADPHQAAHRPRPRHPAPARSARPDEPRSQPLRDDLLRGILPTTSTNAPRTGHISPLNCDFRLVEAHVHRPVGAQGLSVGADAYDLERRSASLRVVECTLAQLVLMRARPESEALRAVFAGLVAQGGEGRYPGCLVSGQDVVLPWGVGAGWEGKFIANVALVTAGAGQGGGGAVGDCARLEEVLVRYFE
ncbi:MULTISPECIES: transposase family protein [unclassified Streptomyces]|uniref:transposase family protein n=1 Tax=unclassified Streptomyces TaxID=2593676 RepID=UPI0035D6A7CB